jgi:glucosamine-6-phosphate deaminase
MGTIMDAAKCSLMVSGIAKARGLRGTLVEMGVNHMWTISCLQLHPKAILVCDDDATSELRVGTYAISGN